MIELEAKGISPREAVLSTPGVRQGPCTAVRDAANAIACCQVCNPTSHCKRHDALKCCALVIGIKAGIWHGRTSCDGDCDTCEDACPAVKILQEAVK